MYNAAVVVPLVASCTRFDSIGGEEEKMGGGGGGGKGHSWIWKLKFDGKEQGENGNCREFLLLSSLSDRKQNREGKKEGGKKKKEKHSRICLRRIQEKGKGSCVGAISSLTSYQLLHRKEGKEEGELAASGVERRKKKRRHSTEQDLRAYSIEFDPPKKGQRGGKKGEKEKEAVRVWRHNLR